MVGDVGSDGVAAGHDAGAGGGADGSGGVEAIKDDGVLGHFVEVGSLDEGVPGVAAIAVALVVGHDENDVGVFSPKSKIRNGELQTNEKKERERAGHDWNEMKK